MNLSARPSRASFLAVTLAALPAAACGARVEVGEAKDVNPSVPAASSTPTPSSSVGTPEPAQMPAEPPPDCTAADATAREPYDTWRVLPNQLGALAGKTFDGYIEGGPDVTLTIGAAGDANLVIGVPAPPPEADTGYLCGELPQDGSQCWRRYDYPPVEGAVYPLHGASFADGRLQAQLQPNAPYDAWCALQTPHEADVCFFAEIGLEGFGVNSSTNECSYADAAVDCGWLELAQMGLCRCTTSACFANIHPETPFMPKLDARFDTLTGELSGSVVKADRPPVLLRLLQVAP